MTFYQCLGTRHSPCDGAGCPCWCHSLRAVAGAPRGPKSPVVATGPTPVPPAYAYQEQVELDQF